MEVSRETKTHCSAADYMDAIFTPFKAMLMALQPLVPCDDELFLDLPSWIKFLKGICDQFDSRVLFVQYKNISNFVVKIETQDVILMVLIGIVLNS